MLAVPHECDPFDSFVPSEPTREQSVYNETDTMRPPEWVGITTVGTRS